MLETIALVPAGPAEEPVIHSNGREALDELLGGLVLRDRWKPNWRAREVAGRIFLSSEEGGWAILTREEFAMLRSVAIPVKLHNLLEARGLIITEKNAACVMRAYKRWSSNYFGTTSLHILGMTRRCNLSCHYCHASVVAEDADRARFDMDEATARDIVDFAFQSPSSRVHFEFQGGEASLNFDVVRYVYTYAALMNLKHKRQLTFSIVSNGVAVDDAFIDWLETTGVGVTTSVELPDYGKAGHLRLDKDGRSRAEEVWRNRRRIEARGLCVPQLIVIGRNNLHKMIDHIDAAVAAEQSSIFFSPVQKLGFAKGKWGEVGIEMDEFYAAYAEAMDHLFSWWDKGVLIEERYFSLALEKLFSERDTKYSDWRNPNGMVFSVMAYDQHGNVYACDEGRGHADFRIGNARTDRFADVIASPKALELVSHSLREHPECQSCGYKAFCGVSPIVSKGECGRLDTPPLTSSTCQRTLHLMDFVVGLMAERPERIDQALAIIAFSSRG
ncbi:MAG: uncharacterized protein QOJ94_2323 [Sphingomonadales bacterium]|jgi:radical SAM protein with 4Fe4S-binding SPASM domain|nr:uncharacterized protein [Sphingomonadales bacterium]